MNRLKSIWKKLGAYWRTRGLRLFPLRRALRNYGPQQLRGDLNAGLNVALLAFPQGMAYAVIAGLPIEYGIYGSAVAALVAPLFSASRYIMLGPTNATAVLLFTVLMGVDGTEAEKLLLLPLIVSMSGIFLVIGAFTGIATLIQYVSRSVVTGYITAASLYIIVNQSRKALGISFEIPEGSTFFSITWLTVTNTVHTHLPSLILSIITAAFFIFLKKRYANLPGVALTLVVMVFAALGLQWAFLHTDHLNSLWGNGLNLLHAVDATQWRLTPPAFRGDWISEYAGTAMILAFLSVLEGTSIGKSLAARHGEKLDANQETLGMGMANIGCGIAGGMTASGSLTRSQLGFDSGASSPMASVFTGFILIIGAFLLGPLIKYIPEAALGVLVIGIGISLIDRHVIRIVMKTTHADAIVFVVTFLVALFIRLDVSIIVGAATSIYLFLRKAAAPELVEYQFNEEGSLTAIELTEQRKDPEVSIVHVEGDLFFGAAELFRDQLRRAVEDPNLKILVLKMRNAYHLDATSVLALEELIRYMETHERTLIVSEARKEVLKVLKNSGLREIISRENIFVDDPGNPTMSTAKALRRAKSILGGLTPKVSIYAKEKAKKRAAEAADRNG